MAFINFRICVLFVLLLLVPNYTFGKSHQDLRPTPGAQATPQQPAEIVFPDGKKAELAVGGKQIIKAYVLDRLGNRIRGGNLTWRLAKEDDEAFVYIGRSKETDGVHTVELIWRPGRIDMPSPAEVEVLATAGSVVGVISIVYKQVPQEEYEFAFQVNNMDVKALEVQPGKTIPVKVIVKSKKNQAVIDKEKVNLSASIADEKAASLIKLAGPDKDKVVTLIGVYGDPKGEPSVPTSLVVKALGALGSLPVTYRRDPVTTSWEILPPSVVGDNYGRTIKNDYYCIEIMIQNNSGTDLALAGLTFDLNGRSRPVTSYSTVNGSLAKRKLTHPRSLTLAIVDGLGSLLTGFNPFFHNDSHAANYSQFIDIVSNPFAKGLASVWKDSYPDELSRFQQDVLKDDKILANTMTFKTKVFFPKRALFKNNDPKRGDFDEVRKRLGELIVIGYRLQGPAQNLSRTP